MADQDTKTLKAGHRVRLQDDERLDITDALALQELGLSYAVEALGALMGGDALPGSPTPDHVGGTFSKLTVDPAVLADTKIYGPEAGKRAMFGHAYKSDSGEAEFEVLIYDPNLTGQMDYVDLTGLDLNQPVVVWARRLDTPLDVDTRRFWDSGAGSEVLDSIPTRERYRIKFQATQGATPPDADVRWFPILSSLDNAPTFAEIHPFDAGLLPPSAFGGDGDGFDEHGSFGGGSDGDYGLGAMYAHSLKTLGMIQALRLITKRIAEIKKGGTNAAGTVFEPTDPQLDWHAGLPGTVTDPDTGNSMIVTGIPGINILLARFEYQIARLVDRANRLEQPYVCGVAGVYWNNVTATWELDSARSWGVAAVAPLEVISNWRFLVRWEPPTLPTEDPQNNWINSVQASVGAYHLGAIAKGAAPYPVFGLNDYYLVSTQLEGTLDLGLLPPSKSNFHQCQVQVRTIKHYIDGVAPNADSTGLPGDPPGAPDNIPGGGYSWPYITITAIRHSSQYLAIP